MSNIVDQAGFAGELISRGYPGEVFKITSSAKGGKSCTIDKAMVKILKRTGFEIGVIGLLEFDTVDLPLRRIHALNQVNPLWVFEDKLGAPASIQCATGYDVDDADEVLESVKEFIKKGAKYVFLDTQDRIFRNLSYNERLKGSELLYKNLKEIAIQHGVVIAVTYPSLSPLSINFK